MAGEKHPKIEGNNVKMHGLTPFSEQVSPFSDTKATSLTVGGLLLEQSDTAGLTTTFDYDALQRRVGTTDARTGRSFVTYHPTNGLVVSHSTPHSALGTPHLTTLFTYDDTGRQIAVTDPEGNTTHTAYTLRGEVAATWGATYPVVYEYDDYGRMIHLHTLRDPTVTFNPEVSPAGILTSTLSTLTSPMDTTTWIYESTTGLLLEKLYADNKGPAYTYTPDGRLLTRTWARTTDNQPPTTNNQLTTTYHYDPDTLELTQITYSDDTPTVTNEYDRLGRLTKTTDAFGEKIYTYDPDTLQPQTEIWDGLVETTLTREYDDLGRPEGFSLGNAYTVTHDYTDQGRFNAVSYDNDVNPAQHTATYTYTNNSRLISGYTLGDLTRAVTFENNRNLIDKVTNTWDTTLISQFDYTNDDAGRRTNCEDSGAAFSATQQNTFGYNARNEVINAAMRNGNSIYNFDQIGNRTSVTTPDAPNAVSYLTNALNQYTEINGAAAPPPPISPVHDEDGNLIDDDKGTTFEWNAENRMVRVEKDDMVMLNTYDGQGRRVRKQIFDNGNPIEDHRYFYDAWNLIYEIDVLATNPEPTYYVWGLDLSQSLQGAGGVGGLLLVLTPNFELPATAHAVSYDANGNISEYINLANGNIDAHLEYDAFGRIIASTDTAPSNFGFSTKYEDVEIGYLYYGFRYYDPETGRWPNRDPIEERGGYNLYGFVGNQSTSKIDILGLFDIPDDWEWFDDELEIPRTPGTIERRQEVKTIIKLPYYRTEEWREFVRFDTEKCVCVSTRHEGYSSSFKNQDVWNIYAYTDTRTVQQIAAGLYMDHLISLIPYAGKMMSVHGKSEKMLKAARAHDVDPKSWTHINMVLGKYTMDDFHNVWSYRVGISTRRAEKADDCQGYGQERYNFRVIDTGPFTNEQSQKLHNRARVLSVLDRRVAVDLATKNY